MFYVLNNDQRKQAAIEHLNMLNTEKLYSVDIKPYVKNRSNSQNRLYWSWLKILAGETGHTDDDLHEIMKVRFLGVIEKEVYGEKLRQPKSTTDLTTKEFTDYLTMIEVLAHSMNITLVRPDDYRYAMGMNEVPRTASLSVQPPQYPMSAGTLE